MIRCKILIPWFRRHDSTLKESPMLTPPLLLLTMATTKGSIKSDVEAPQKVTKRNLRRSKTYTRLPTSEPQCEECPLILHEWIQKTKVKRPNNFVFIKETMENKNVCGLLGYDQDYSIRYNFTYKNNARYYKVTLCICRDTIMELSTSGAMLKDCESRLGSAFVASTISYIDSKWNCDNEDIIANMDSTEDTEQGPTNVTGTKDINTIMTTAEAQATGVEPITFPYGLLDGMCNGQEAPEFPVWQERLLALTNGNFTINDARWASIRNWSFPRDLYAGTMDSTPVVRPFQQFMFVKSNVEVVLKVNSNKFMSGRYLLSYVYEPRCIANQIPQIGGTTRVLGTRDALTRDHVLIDLAESNEVRLNMPWRNKSPYTTSLVNNQNSYRGAENIMLSLMCITPLRVADGAPTTAPWQLFVRIPNTKFAGMRFAIRPSRSEQEMIANMEEEVIANMGNSSFKSVSQSYMSAIKTIPMVGGMISGASNSLGHLAVMVQKPFRSPETIKNIEKDLKYIGVISNRDKPTDIRHPMEVRPNATGNLAAGTNIAEAIIPLRLDPTATTIILEEHDPQHSPESLFEIVRIWGYCYGAAPEWTMTNTTGTLLFETNVAPAYDMTSNSGTQATLPPIDYVSTYFTYYQGSVEFRFDFIATQFHVGSVLIAYVPYHDDFNYEEANSGYWKVFDLREQKSVVFTVPYINNTIVRMIRGGPISGYGFDIPSAGRIKMFVVNPLTPIEGVSSSVAINVFKRAGPDFSLSYPRRVNGQQGRAIHYSDIAYGLPATRDDTDEVEFVANMDTGEKEDIDQTPDFTPCIPAATLLQTAEDHMNIKNLMRRWIHHGRLTLTANVNTAVPVVLPHIRRDGFPRTLQQMICRIFRYYRGGIRIMGIIKNPNAIVYTTHIPQGTWCHFGTVPNNSDPTNSGSNHFSGMATQVAVSRINPVFKYEVPWHGVYDYLDCQYGQGGTNPTTVIDRIATNLGHLIFTSDTDTDIELYISIDDTGKFFKFQGNALTANQYASNGTRTIIDSKQEERAILSDVQLDEDEGIMIANMDPDKTHHHKWCPETLYTETDLLNGRRVTCLCRTRWIKLIKRRCLQIMNADYTSATIRNGHYITCVWSNPHALEGPDTCHCFKAHERAAFYVEKICTAVMDDRRDKQELDQQVPMIANAGDDREINDAIMGPFTGRTDVELVSPPVQGFCRRVYNRLTQPMVDATQTVSDVAATIRRLPILEQQASTVVTKADEAMEYVKNIAHNIVDGIKKSCRWITNVGAVFSGVLHFLQSILNPCWQSFAISVCGVLISLGCFCSEFGQRFMDWITSINSPAEERPAAGEGEFVANCEHDCGCGSNCADTCRVCTKDAMFSDSSIATLLSLMFASVSAFIGFKGEAPGISITKGLFNFSKNFWLTIYQSGRFLQSMVTLVKRIFKYIGLRTPEISGHIAVTEDNHSVTEFIKEANLMMDERNLERMREVPGLKTRFWYCVAAAHQMVVRFTSSTLPEKSAILRLANKVIDKGNERAIQDMACPVRYEPFVVSLEGPSNIGKSFISQHVAPRLLKDAFEVTSYKPLVYVRTPGVQFWNGFNHLGIIYDDFLAVLDPQIAAQQTSELYNLKSSAPMNLNMAAINEKERDANPFMVWLNRMNAFVTMNGVVNKKSQLRRCDSPWHAEFKTREELLDMYPELILPMENIKTSDLPSYVLDKFDHLKFARYADPTDQNSLQTYVSYDEWYNELVEEAKKYHKREQRNVRKRIDRLVELLPITAQTMMRGVDPFRMFYAAYTGAVEQDDLIQTGLLPSQLIDEQLRTIIAAYPEEEQPMRANGYEETWNWFKDWIHFLMYEKPDKNLTQAFCMSECGICLEEGLMLYTCVNGHMICGRCEQGQREASEEDQDIAYSCAQCRSEILPLTDTPLFSAEVLRPVLWKYRMKQKMATWTWQGTKDLAVKIFQSPYTRIALSSLYLLAVVSLSTFTNAHARNEVNQSLDGMQIPWLEEDDQYPINTVCRWGPFWYNQREFVTRAEYRMRANMDEEPSTSSGRQRKWQHLRRMEHAELKQYIPNKQQVYCIADDVCPHERLLKLYEDGEMNEVDYETHDDGHEYWTNGLFDGIPIALDKPCQNDCRWFGELRHNFLNEWAYHNTSAIKHRKAEWTKRHHRYDLPIEFYPANIQTEHDKRIKSMMKQLRRYRTMTWTETLTGIWNDFGKAIKVGLAIVAGIVTLAGGIKLVNWLKAGTVSNMISSGTNVTKHIRHTRLVPRTVIANLSTNVYDVASKMVIRNAFFVIVRYVEKGVVKERKLRGIGIYGRVGLIPGHYAKYIVTNKNRFDKGLIEEFTVDVQMFSHREMTRPLKIDYETFLHMENDFAVFESPKDFPMYKDITSNMPTAEQHRHIGNVYAHLETDANQQLMNEREGYIRDRCKTKRVKGTEFWDNYEIFDAYITDYGREGSCGAILVSENITNPLFAMHVAGADKRGECDTGCAIPLIREDFEALKQNTAVCDYWIPEMEPAYKANIQLDGAIHPVGKVSKDLVSFMPMTSKIEPSLLQGKIQFSNGETVPVETQPSILSPYDERYVHDKSPLVNGCLKHTNPPGQVDDNKLAYIVDAVSSHFNTEMKPLRNVSQPLTLDEAITGFNDLEFYDPIDLSTSAGWPWNTGSKKVKRDFVTVTRDKHSKVTGVWIDDELRKNMAMKQAQRRKGIVPFTVFQDWLKDERRNAKKLALKDGTRIFSLSPVDFTIQCRQRFLDFCASFMKYRMRLMHAVGISVDGTEWSCLANKLLSKSEKIVTGDFKDFGPRLINQLVRAAIDIIKRWFIANGMKDEAILQEMEVMAEEIANAQHICKDFVYSVICGAPSGSPLTTIINTIVHILLILYVYFEIFPDHTFEDFRRHVEMFAYGDDEIMAVDEEICEEFNCLTIANELLKLGIVYTDATKSGTEKYTTIDRATFLKCGFKEHPYWKNEYLACLEKRSVYECAQWVWKSRDKTSATVENAEASLRLAYGHGPEFYNEWKKSLNRALSGLRMKTLSLTWEKIDSQFFSDCEPIGISIRCTRPDKLQWLSAESNASALAEARLKAGVRMESDLNRVSKFYTGDSSEMDASLA